jgi:integrase
MARLSSLEPTFLQSRHQAGKAAWCLNIPASLSHTGKDRRQFYPTKKEGALDAERLQRRQDNFGISLSALSPSRIAEAAEALKLLEGSSLSLLAAVKAALATHKQQNASILFSDLFDQFIAAKADRSSQYQTQLRWCRARFKALHRRLVCDITVTELEDLLRSFSGASRNAMIRYLKAVFSFGLKRGFLPENPVCRLDFVHRKRREVETIPNEQVEKMLEHALADDLELLPFLVFGFFCGIRPDEELPKLAWSDVHIADKEIVIGPEVSKTRRRRFVELSENAVRWLTVYSLKGGSMKGQVVPWTKNVLRTRARLNRQAAGIKKWTQQGARHTFCSNWLATHKDVNKLVLMSGHDSVDTMWRRYYKGVREEEAKAFWQIRPKEEFSDKIVAFGS